MDGPPPPPPPHGANPKTTSGGLPPGNYDIFIIPPHSAGGGFLYLPSLQVQRNSFIAGVISTLTGLLVWKSVEPTVKQYFLLLSTSVASGGSGVVLLVLVVGIAGWAFGNQMSAGGLGGSTPGSGPQGGPGAAGGSASGTGYQRAQPPPNGGFQQGGAQPNGSSGAGWQGGHQHRQHNAAPPEQESWSGSQPDPSSRAEWDKAREETRKREEERKRAEEDRKKAEEERKKAEDERKKAEEAQKRREEEQKKKDEADRQARAKAEKEKWEKMRAREREQREREARERIAREKKLREDEARAREQREKEAREAEARVKIEREVREKLEAESKALRERMEAEQKAMREQLEAEQKAKAEAEAKKKADEDKAAAEAAAAKAKADAERAERLKAARERAQREREAREARVKAEADKLKATVPDLSSAGRRSTTYGGIGGGERTDPYAGAASPPAPSVTSTHSSPIKVNVSPKKNYEKPSAKSYVGTEDAHSFRPYDAPRRPPKPPSHASSAFTESSYAPSQSTSRTTPPPSQRGPYSTNDPDKIQIRAVFLFNDLFPKPVAQLVSGIGHVTDGLILKIQSEGLFIDDDVRNVPQREWDIKAWTLKLVETGEKTGKYLLRACVRDADGKKYVFIIDASESWKVARGLQRLRKGSQTRSLGNGVITQGEITRILNMIPPIA